MKQVKKDRFQLVEYFSLYLSHTLTSSETHVCYACADIKFYKWIDLCLRKV